MSALSGEIKVKIWHWKVAERQGVGLCFLTCMKLFEGQQRKDVAQRFPLGNALNQPQKKEVTVHFSPAFEHLIPLCMRELPMKEALGFPREKLVLE